MTESIEALEITEELRSEQEIPFGYDQLFYERINLQGLVSSPSLGLERLCPIGQSQNPLDRFHSSTPKGVIGWIQGQKNANKPFTSYVKLKAHDGRIAWFMCVIIPCFGEGFISLYFKPSSAHFAAYQTYCEGKKAFDESEMAHALGFESALHFMAQSLGQEWHDSKDRPKNTHIHNDVFQSLTDNARALKDVVVSIQQSYDMNQFVPMNLRVKAAQLGADGQAIDVISNNYSLLSEEIRSQLEPFTKTAALVDYSIQSAIYHSRLASLLDTLAGRSDWCEQTTEADDEKELIKKLTGTHRQESRQTLTEISRESRRIHDICANLKRLSLGLEVTRIMGKVESARLTAGDLNSLILDLDQFQISVNNCLKEMGDINLSLNQAVLKAGRAAA
jgi:aerotaxis receptor